MTIDRPRAAPRLCRSRVPRPADRFQACSACLLRNCAVAVPRTKIDVQRDEAAAGLPQGIGKPGIGDRQVLFGINQVADGAAVHAVWA